MWNFDCCFGCATHDTTEVLLRKKNANQSNYIAITILPINYSRNFKTYTNSRVSWLCIQIST